MSLPWRTPPRAQVRDVWKAREGPWPGGQQRCHRPRQGAQPDCRPPLLPRTRGRSYPLVSSGTLSQMRQVPSVFTSPTLPRPGSQLPAWGPSVLIRRRGQSQCCQFGLCPSCPEPPAAWGAGHMPAHSFPDRTGWHPSGHAHRHTHADTHTLHRRDLDLALTETPPFGDVIRNTHVCGHPRSVGGRVAREEQSCRGHPVAPWPQCHSSRTVLSPVRLEMMRLSGQLSFPIAPH